MKFFAEFCPSPNKGQSGFHPSSYNTVQQRYRLCLPWLNFFRQRLGLQERNIFFSKFYCCSKMILTDLLMLFFNDVHYFLEIYLSWLFAGGEPYLVPLVRVQIPSIKKEWSPQPIIMFSFVFAKCNNFVF